MKISTKSKRESKKKEKSVNSSKILYKNKTRQSSNQVSGYGINNSSFMTGTSKRSVSKSRSPSQKRKRRSVSKSSEIVRKSRSKTKSASKIFNIRLIIILIQRIFVYILIKIKLKIFFFLKSLFLTPRQKSKTIKFES